MKARLWLIPILALGLASSVSADQSFTLGSGKTIDVVGVGPIQFSQSAPALMLKYNTSLAISDMQALHREADEIWNRLAMDAEKGKYQSAIISANSGDTGGIISHTQGFNFIYQKNQNGNWRYMDFGNKDRPVLTEQITKDVMARFDQAMETNEMNTALLYLGDNWALTVIYPGNNKPADKQNRMEFATTSFRAFTRIKDFKHTRKIDKVTVSEDAKSAQVESDEITTGTIEGKPINLTEHSVDVIGTEGSSIVLTQSSSALTAN